MSVLSIQYSYRRTNEKDVELLFSQIEKELGGVRAPYDSRFGAIDIVTLITISISFLLGIAFQTALEKYFEGLLNGDAIMRLGEDHRKQLDLWLSEVNSRLIEIVERAEPLRTTHSIGLLGNEEAITLQVLLGQRVLYAVTNHTACSQEILSNLPEGIMKVLKLAIENQLPEDSQILQLYFDKNSKRWKYLFLPRMKTYGRLIDRYLDMDTGELHIISSRKEFLSTFQPNTKDEFKFLLSPFIER